MWSARDRTVIAKTKHYLEERKSLKVEIEELESLLGPDDTDVDFRRSFWKKQGTKKVVRYLRLSAQTVRVNSWWSVVRGETTTKGG